MSAHFDQIKSTLDQLCAAWKSNDGAAVGGFFVEDGTLINPFGHRAAGRTQVAAMYSEYFSGMLRGTTTTFELGSVRALGADLAFVDAEQVINGPDDKPVLVVHLAALLRREGDRWRFVDGRPYAFSTAGG